MSKPDQQPTKAQQRQATYITREANKARTETTKRQKRRLLIGGLLGVSTLALGGGAFLIADRLQLPKKPVASDLVPGISLQKAPMDIHSNLRSGSLSLETPTGEFDRGYLTDILESAINNPTSDPKSVINNLSLARIRQQKGVATTNALLIDESGYYITCGHTFTTLTDTEKSSEDTPQVAFINKNAPAMVINPSVMKRYPIQQYLVDPAHDLAIFYAPTGFRRSMAYGISLETSDLPIGTGLWQPALQLSDRLNLNVMYGLVDQNDSVDEFNQKSVYKDRIGVKGMIPHGGSSGSPIITSTGRVYAIESGYFVKATADKSKPFSFEDYDGSLVSPIKRLLALAQTGEVSTLPVEKQ
jgi:hypothetical protein